MRQLLFLPLLAAVVACHNENIDPVIPPPPPPAPPGLLISGGDMSGYGQNIYVTRDNAAVTDAVVTVNGTTMPHVSFGTYQGLLNPVVAPGGQITVVVASAGQTATGVAQVPATATLQTPAPVTRGNPVYVTWTSAVSPDSFFVGLNYTIGGTGYNTYVRVAGTARQAVIPTTDIPAGTSSLSLEVFGYNRGAFTGDFVTGSNMRVRTLNTDLPFTFAGP